MKRFELSCWVFKDEDTLAMEQNAMNDAVAEGAKRMPVRITVNIPLVAENYVKSNRRITKLINTATGIEWNIPTRDLALVVSDQEFEVTDLRGKS